MPVWGGHLTDYTGVAEVALIPEALGTPTKDDVQTPDTSQPQGTPLQQAMAQQAMEAVAHNLLTPDSAVKAAGEPKAAEPGAKRAKKTPGNTPVPGSPAPGQEGPIAGELDLSQLHVSGDEKEVFHDAAAPGRWMWMEWETPTNNNDAPNTTQPH